MGGVVFSFAFGDLTAVLFSKLLFGEPRGFFDPACLFLGIISTATSVGITARILSEKRQMDSPEGVTILAGAVIDDVLGIIMLAIGLGVISATGDSGGRVDWGRIGLIALKAIGVWLVATALGLAAARRISRLLQWFGHRTSIATLALGLALIVGGLFEEAGLAMIIGAYVTGLSLSRTDVRHLIIEKVEPIYSLLVPIFFTVMGMLVDVRLIASPKVLLFGAIYTVIAMLAKVLGCGGAAMFCGFNLRGGLRIGLGMLPRGEVALIVAGIGMAAGLLTPEVFGVAVLMTLATTLIAPPLLVGAFGSSASGKRKPESREQVEPLVFSFPSEQTADLLTNKLLAVFESEGFFVYPLNRDEHLYQISRDAMNIGFQRRGSDIVFDCDRDEVPFISAALYEVLIEFEQTVRDLRNPVDRAAVARRLQEQAGAGAGALAPFLNPAAMEPVLKGATKTEIIDELLDLLRRRGIVTNVTEARQAVLAREESMSTGMQYGIAIPHGRTDAVDRLVCAVGLKRDGLPFDSLDGQPARIVILSLSPRTAAAPHVQFMSAISQALDERTRLLLLACTTAADMYAVLTRRIADKPPARHDWRLAAARIAGRARARLGDYLTPDLVEPYLRGATRDAVIDELLERMRAAGLIRAIEPVRLAVHEREAQMPTGLESGIAIPHATTNQVDRLICAVGIKREGVNFGALDGQPTQIVVLTLAPPHVTAPYVRVMATIAHALDEQGRQRVLAACTREELFETLAELS